MQNIKKRQTLEVFKERLRLKSEILLLIKKQTRLYAKQVGQEHLPYHKEATRTAQNFGTNARTVLGTNRQREKLTDKVTLEVSAPPKNGCNLNLAPSDLTTASPIARRYTSRR